MSADQPEPVTLDPLPPKWSYPDPALRGQVDAALDRLAGRCTDPAPESCADADCPEHGTPTAVWVTCPGCSVLVPDGEACGECGRPL
jgi:hypothetical protein